MGASFKAGLTLDRIDNNGDYCPDNCRWATHNQQRLNRSDSITYPYKGKLLTLKRIEILTGIPYRTLVYRVQNGFTEDEVYSKRPIRRNRKDR